MKDEGSIKFNCTWIKCELPDRSDIEQINIWRQKLFSKQLIGAYADGTGYGNISVRLADNTFLITGTATGHIRRLTEKQYTRVTGYDILKNRLTCEGPVNASSESLTHAVFYESIPQINAVVHVHNNVLWKKLIDKVPTTSHQVKYGTPEMAIEIGRLLKSTHLKDEKIIVMAGHKDGLIAYGKDVVEAALNFLEST